MHRLFLYIVFTSTFTCAQYLVIKTGQGTTSLPIRSSAQASFANDSIIVSPGIDTETMQWIVELKSQPAHQHNLYKTAGPSPIATDHSAFLHAMKTAVPSVEVKKEYSVIMNGFTVAGTEKDIAKLRSMPEVENIYEDIIVTTLPVAASLPFSSTFTVQDSYTGEGIKIGIIDSGTDYFHEALGGGFGAGFRIEGGYDFVNNDPDPMDDNGHGTHVAGIIGGDSPMLKGIARTATLYSYKVLGTDGCGSISDVLAAIERAVHDGIDIINLSLGSPNGNPNDVLCKAVDRAVESGIVVVAAAGNTGDFETIHSPGIAGNALTVGATDGSSVAAFSAKGPVADGYRIKPDLVAPGVGIRSAHIGGGYATMSGTSMAAPIVASIAAVLKEMHPAWNAFQIKDALLSGAKNLNAPLFAQGSGSITDNIFSDRVIVRPASISFGFDPPALGQWTATDTIEVFNATSGRKKYDFRYRSANPAITIELQPTSMEIEPSASRRVVVTLTTNNLFLGNKTQFAEGYTGTVYGYGENDTLTIPFTFFKGYVLQLVFSETPRTVLIHDQKKFRRMFAPKSDAVSAVVEHGTYDVISSFSASHFVIKENIPVDGRSSVTINKAEATNAIAIVPVNERGLPPDVTETGTYHFMEGIMFKQTGIASVSMGGGMMAAENERIKHFSPMSDKYSYGYSLSLQYGTALSYTFETVLDSGITASRSIAFAPSDLKKVEMKYSVDPSTRRIFPVAWTSYIGAGSKAGVTSYNGNDAPLMYPFVQTNYITNRTSPFPLYRHIEAFSY